MIKRNSFILANDTTNIVPENYLIDNEWFMIFRLFLSV